MQRDVMRIAACMRHFGVPVSEPFASGRDKQSRHVGPDLVLVERHVPQVTRPQREQIPPVVSANVRPQVLQTHGTTRVSVVTVGPRVRITACG